MSKHFGKIVLFAATVGAAAAGAYYYLTRKDAALADDFDDYDDFDDIDDFEDDETGSPFKRRYVNLSGSEEAADNSTETESVPDKTEEFFDDDEDDDINDLKKMDGAL